MIEVATELTPAWGKYERWATLCTAGRCAYDGLPANQAAPPWEVEERCPGYAGFYYPTPPVIRVRSCDRKLAWAKRRREFIREERKKAREREKAMKAAG
jgi:hypothetical protein